MKPTTKLDVNKFWLEQDFRLNIKSYEGNCDLCFKKSDRKLLTILKENPDSADWWHLMAAKYGKEQYNFYRQNRSILELLKQSQLPFIQARDESKDVVRYTQMELFDDLDISNGCEESCEPFLINY